MSDIEIEYNYLKAALAAEVLEVTFTKKNGDERIMTCTLQPEHLPPLVEAKEGDAPKKVRKENIEVVSAYDLKAKGWRSFRVDSVTKVQPA